MSSSSKTFLLTSAEKRLLKAWAGQEGSLALRARIVLRLADGKTHKEVAKMLKTSSQTVSLWSRRYREGGVEALADAPRSGRPRASQEVVEQVCSARLGEISAAADSAGIARSTAHRIRKQHPDLVPKPEKRNWPEPPPMASYQDHWHYRHGLRHTVWHKPKRKKEAEDDV